MGIAVGMKDITQDIAASYEARVSRVGRLKSEVGRLKKEAEEMMGSFQTSRQKMAAQLKRHLGRDRAQMASKVRAMRKDFQTSHSEIGSAVRKNLVEYTQAVREETAKIRREMVAHHQDINRKLEMQLAQGIADRRSAVNEMRSSFDKDRAEVRADLKGAATAWQKLTDIMQAKRSGTKPPLKVKVAEEKTPSLEAKLLAVISEHPSGIPLTEAAEKLGAAVVVLGRAARSLLGDGKILKADKLYFPVI